MSVEIERRQEGGVVTLRVLPSGREELVPSERRIGFDVDLLDCVTLEQALGAEDAAGSSRLVIDLTDVMHLHSRGLWTIVEAARRRYDSGGGLALSGLSPNLARTVELTSAGDTVVVAGSTEQAIALLTARK